MIPLRDNIPSQKKPIVTTIILSINILVFFYQLSLGADFEGFILKYGAIPDQIMHGERVTPYSTFPFTLTLFTAMFLHGGLWHLLGNMLYLWIFGDNIEERLGHLRFLILYIVSGLAASFAHIFMSPNSQLPMVGASGAIAGILGAYMIEFPYAKILTLVFFGFFIRVVSIPAFFVLGFWFILQLIYASTTLGVSGGGGIAWFAHIGGFLAGIILFRLLRKRSHWI
ncbi:MAG: rhomboid family intramembrane serine protease [candidate division Zixibacteria bacterium]|nr:rhomboid family intramembrane serine protease [candidate division Zixibacteria bacterium]